MTDISKAMNNFLRGKGSAPQPQQVTGLTDEQEAQVLKYIQAGASPREAIDLVAGYEKPVTPAGHAGSGTGHKPRLVDMNEEIRRLSRRG